jgi:glycerol-3-phosphate dehydrogenase
VLKGTASLDLTRAAEGAPLQSTYERAFEYSDCWVEDARLVLLNARDAQARGATILPRTEVIGAQFEDGAWTVETRDETGTRETHRAKMIVNAGGPWVESVINQTLRLNSKEGVRLVRGSHIVTKRLYDHDKCYFFQGEDGRIIFAIPYEEDYTLIGTTDAEHTDAFSAPVCTEAERDYLCRFASNYFERPVTAEDVVWTYSGVRPLYDDGASSATAATRDYVLTVNTTAGGPVLNVFGGKITTYRKLAESALEKIDATLSKPTAPWTAGVALPGGHFEIADAPRQLSAIAKALPFFDAFTHRRLLRQYGTQALQIFEGAETRADCGTDFGHGLTAREVDWAIANEWVFAAEDMLWRRSKMGLRLDHAQQDALATYIDTARATLQKAS